MRILFRMKQYEFTHLTPLWVSTFIDIIGFSIVIPYLPQFTTSFGATLTQVGLLLATNSLFSFFGNIFWGSMSDRVGRKPVLLICQFGTLVGFLVLAFSTNLRMLFLSRIIDGVFGGNIPIAKAMIGDVVPPDKRGKEMSNLGVAWTIGSLLGPGIGGLLSGFGIMGPGLLCVGLSLFTMLVTVFFLRESNRSLKKQQPLHKQAKQPNAKPLSLSLLKQLAPRLLLLQWFFNTLSFFIFISTVSLYVSVRFHLNTQQIGWILTGAGVLKLFVRFFIFLPILNKFGDEKTVRIGFIIYIIAYTGLIMVGTIWEYLVINALVSFATACTLDVLSGLMSKAVSNKKQGEMMGLSAAVDNISQIIGPVLGSALLALPISFAYGLSTAAISLLPLLISFIPLKARPGLQKDFSPDQP